MKPVALVFAALAATVAAQYNITSNPFRLFLKSDNATIDGTALGACHQGAATEGLCLTGERRTDPAAPYTTFYHNISSWTTPLPPPNAADEYGALVWILHAGGGLNVSCAMRLSESDTSNVAVPIFFPSDSQGSAVMFDDCGNMYIPAYQDDTRSPPTNFDPPVKVMNWYICLTRWSYTYETLVWKIGLLGEPQNPSCKKVDVERVWVE